MQDEYNATNTNPKDAIGRKKPGMSKLPLGPLFAAGEVMKLGANKYGPYNWRGADVSASVYFDAIMRHLYQWWEGEDYDAESGQSHLAHIIANCALVMDAESRDRLVNDRAGTYPPVVDVEWCYTDLDDVVKNGDYADLRNYRGPV
jgi:hypothetical protein